MKKLRQSACLIWIIFVTWVCCGNSQDWNCSLQSQDYDALRDLYNFTNGQHWNWPSPANEWTFPSKYSAPCEDSWAGITCILDRDDIGVCFVSVLSLAAFNLTGSLSTSLGNISQITMIELQGNTIAGDIPSSLGSLRFLSWLDLSSNRFVHSLPSELGNAKNLTHIDFSSNQLTGSIPTSFGELIVLQGLNLANNFMTGWIPSTFAKCSQLQQLSLYSNSLSGPIPSSLQHLKHISTLNIGSNFLNGYFPNWICNLHSLTILAVNNNMMNGTIPSGLGSLNLIDLQLQYNSLTGSIPSSVGSLLQLTSLKLLNNYLVGTFPTSFEMLTNLAYLDLSSNLISGPLTTQISNMISLEYLLVTNNFINGSIPERIGTLSNLLELYLDFNSLSGIVPSEIGNLSKLIWLYMDYNQLHGTLPASLGKLVMLQGLGLNNNYLSGHIPTALGNNIMLQYLILTSNNLEFTLPSTLISLTALTNLYLNENSLSGSIPDFFGKFRKLEVLCLDYNSFHGSIPSTIADLSHLRILLLNNNLFSHTLSASIARLSVLTYLYLNDNYMVGSLPSELGHALTVLYLSNNLFDGEFPPSFSSRNTIRVLDISNNYLTGSIPQEFCSPKLTYLAMSTNQISGTIPSQFGSMTNLQSAYFANNRLNGTLPASICDLPKLEKLVMFANSLTGVIPTIFGHSLLVLNIEDNCLTGTIPTGICSSIELQEIYLSGASDGNKCQYSVFSGLKSGVVNGVYSLNSLSSSIPNCIWSMPNLTIVQLAANGLTGNIGDIPSDSRLQQLIAPNNMLRGTLPLSIQLHGLFSQLILSNNMLSGTLNPSFVISPTNSTQLSLSLNRFSGIVPKSFESVQSLDVLQGNVFNCSTLPPNDLNVKTYSCGSQNFDVAVALSFFSLVTFALIFLGHCNCQYGRLKTIISEFSACSLLTTSIGRLQSCKSGGKFGFYVSIMERFCHYSLILGLMNITVCMTAFMLLKSVDSLKALFSTHAVQFMWISTALYMRGLAPVCLLFIIMISSLLLVTSLSLRSIDDVNKIASTQPRRQNTVTVSTQTISIGVPTAQFINISVSLAINGLYVLAAVQKYSIIELTCIQISFGAFKVIWTMITNTLATALASKNRRFLTLQRYILLMFNFIIAPLMVTFLTDGNCYYYAFVGNQDLVLDLPSSEYSVSMDLQYDKFSRISSSTTIYTPPQYNSFEPVWSYYYQCTSAVMRYYIPVLLYSFALKAVVIPGFLLWFVLNPEIFLYVVTRFLPKCILQRFVEGSLVYEAILADSNNETPRCGAVLMDSSIDLASIFVSFTVLMTFGLASPLLGLVVMTSVITHCGIYILLTGKILQRSDNIANTVAKFDHCIGDVTHDFATCVPLMLAVVMIFWTCVFGDMTLDVYEIHSSIAWSLCLGVVVPVVLLLAYWHLFRRIQLKPSTTSNTSGALSASLIGDNSETSL